MKNRIFQIMKQEGLNQKDFAATTGISPGTLSSIFNGRTEPSLTTAERLHRRFPMLNMSWLMFGEGDMYIKERNTDGKPESSSVGISGDLFGDVNQTDVQDETVRVSSPAFQFDNDDSTPQKPMVREVVKYVDKPQRRITSITIFFDDGSFETFPGKPVVNA